MNPKSSSMDPDATRLEKYLRQVRDLAKMPKARSVTSLYVEGSFGAVAIRYSTHAQAYEIRPIDAPGGSTHTSTAATVEAIQQLVGPMDVIDVIDGVHAQSPVVRRPVMQTVERAKRQALVDLRDAQAKVDGGAKLGARTLARVQNASEMLAEVEHAQPPPSGPAFGRLTLEQIPRVKARQSADFPGMRNIRNFVPGWSELPYSAAFPSDAIDRAGFWNADSYLLSYLIKDYPRIFQGRAHMIPNTIEISPDGTRFVDSKLRTVPSVRVRFPPNDRPWLIPLILTSDFVKSAYGMLKIAIKKAWDCTHANYVYVDHVHKNIEIFEPHGSSRWGEMVANRMKAFFAPTLPGYTIISLGSICPKGPQRVGARYDQGFCAAYSNLYGVLRVLNPGAPPEEVVKYMSRGGGKAVRQRIDEIAAYVYTRLQKVK